MAAADVRASKHRLRTDRSTGLGVDLTASISPIFGWHAAVGGQGRFLTGAIAHVNAALDKTVTLMGYPPHQHGEEQTHGGGEDREGVTDTHNF